MCEGTKVKEFANQCFAAKLAILIAFNKFNVKLVVSLRLKPMKFEEEVGMIYRK
jgi:hypothetical protein